MDVIGAAVCPAEETGKGRGLLPGKILFQTLWLRLITAPVAFFVFEEM